MIHSSHAARSSYRLGLALSLVLLASCATAVVPRRVELAHAANGLAGVACVERHAARVGAEIMARGGNAADATVAAALVLAVTWPPAGNLGGGGVLVVHTPQGDVAALDFRETAPRAVTNDYFLDANGREDPEVTAHAALPVGMPGTPAGLAALHARFGSLPWHELVEPARQLAAQGFVVDAELNEWLSAFRQALSKHPSSAAVFLNEQAQALREGATLTQPALSKSLTALRDYGAQAFYRGALAKALAADLNDVGGVLTTDDLAAYRAVWREPIRVELAGQHELIGMPPPSSGGIVLGQMLGMLERQSAVGLDSTSGQHLFIEAARRAFAERATWLGDPDQSVIPSAAMLASAHLDALSDSINPDRATPSTQFGPPLTQHESDDTTQLSVVDEAGMAISCTLTLEAAFGSKYVGPRSGVLFNNQLNDFNRTPGLTNRQGRIGTTPNQAAPGRRPLTSMSPVILLQAGRPKLITGSPGGRTILNTVAGVVWRALTQPELSATQLVNAPRLHHGWFPDRVVLEPQRFEAAALQALRHLGHEVIEGDVNSAPLQGTQGAAHLLSRTSPNGNWQAAGDARRDGWVGVLLPIEQHASGTSPQP